MQINLPFGTIYISRPDSIGDVVLTMPMCGYLKQEFPTHKIIFIGQAYTKPVVELCKFVDGFLDVANLTETDFEQNSVLIHVFPDKKVAEIAYRAKVKMRIGTGHRFWLFKYLTHPVFFSRRRSSLHEAQLNFKLFSPLKLLKDPSTLNMPNWYGLVAPNIENIYKGERPLVLLHPKSKGSAREWPVHAYFKLSRMLMTNGYAVGITGTAAEAAEIEKNFPELLNQPDIIDFTGKLTLRQLVKLIDESVALVACSTGPLHIAAALNKAAIGLYTPTKPMHPGRWAPIGNKAIALANINSDCRACKKTGVPCACIASVKPETVYSALIDLSSN